MRTILSRAARILPAIGLVAALGACDSLLEVENFGALDDSEVTDSLLIPKMANAVISEYQRNYGLMVWAGAVLGDEALNGHNYIQWQDFDLRIVEKENSVLDDIYEPVQLARGTGDEMVRRLKELVEPSTSPELATALAYTGMSYILLGEMFCYAPIEGMGPAVESDAILAAAVQRFEEAIAIGETLVATQTGADLAEAERILNLARVGAARASLQQGKMGDAIAFAQDVPVEFTAWARHQSDPTVLRNYLVGATSGTNRYLGLDEPFVSLNDTRVRHAPEPVRGHNNKTWLYTPFQGPSHSEWTADGPDRTFAYDTDIRIASGLEARYIIAEAGGMTDAELEAFINERRAVGGQDPFPGGDLQAELRDQRRRDFFLDGHRLGDLRRYLALYGSDEFPSGPHPNDEEWGWGNYGSATCYVPHLDESTGNPNYTPPS